MSWIYNKYWYMFDGAFAYWREPPISFAVSACLSFRVYQHGSHLVHFFFFTFDNGFIYDSLSRKSSFV